MSFMISIESFIKKKPKVFTHKEFQFTVNSMNFLHPAAALMTPKSPVFSQEIQQFPYLWDITYLVKIKV